MQGRSLSDIVSRFAKDNTISFDGYLMYKDEKVAKIKNMELDTTLNDSLLPVIMLSKSKGSFESWLQTRVIDTHRTNSRQIRRRLSVRSEVPSEIVIKARAVSITDSYWLKWDNETLNFKEVRNRLSDGLNTVALYGNVDNVDFEDIHISPELTNIGSFEKCWRFINGQWYMIKKGTYKENFAEVLVSNIGNHLGFNVVKYVPMEGGRLVKSKDFTRGGKIDFEPMFSFVKDYWEIDTSIKILEELGYIKNFLDITFMDALCYNIDRHTFNFGILRKDGEPVGLAPNFDNNLALSGVLNDSNLEKTWYSTSFTRNNYKPILNEYKYAFPNINFEKIRYMIKSTLSDFPTLLKEDGFEDIVLKIIKNNYMELMK